MHRTATTIVSTVFLVGCGASVTAPGGPGPSDDPKTHESAPLVDRVLEEILTLSSHEQPSVRAGAVLTLGLVGEPDASIVSRLQQALLDESMAVRRSAVLALGFVGADDEATAGLLLARIDTPDLQEQVFCSLGMLGVADHGVAETLVQHLLTMSVHHRSEIATCMGWPDSPGLSRQPDPAWALLRIADGATPLLAARLEQSDTTDKRRVACVLSLIGKDAIPAVLPLLDAPDAPTRAAAAFTLGCIDEVNSLPGVTDGLLPLIADADSTVRVEAAAALSAGGGCSIEVIDSLISAMADQDPGVRGAAAASHYSCTGDPDPSVPVLAEALDAPDPEVELAAAETLLRITPDSKKSVKHLLALCEHPDPRIREMATARVHLLGPEAGFAVKGLMKKLSGQHGSLAQYVASLAPKDGKPVKPVEQQFVVDALVAIGAPCVGPLVEWLEDGEAHEVDQALTILTRIGPDASTAIPAVMSLVETEDPFERTLRLHVLARIGSADPDTVFFLIDMLEDPDVVVRTAAIVLLGDVSIEIEAAREPLAGHISDPEPEIVIAVARSLWKLGALSASEARALLIEPLESSDCDVRREAARALHAIGAHVDLLDSLIVALKPASCPTDPHVLDCIGDLGHDAQPAVSRLLEVLASQQCEAMSELVARTIAKAVVPGRDQESW